MTFKEYLPLQAKTCAELGNHEDNMLHMSAGIATELGELLGAFKKEFAYKKPIDVVNIKEEIGDIYWYVLGSIRFEILKGLEVDLDKLEEIIIENYEYETDKPDSIQKVMNLLLNSFRETSILSLLYRLYALCDYMKFDYREVLDINIAKLKARYGDKFSEEAALNRDLDNERKILEN